MRIARANRPRARFHSPENSVTRVVENRTGAEFEAQQHGPVKRRPTRRVREDDDLRRREN